MAIPVIESYTEYTSTGSVTTIPLAKPSGVAVGDLLLLVVGNESKSDTTQFLDNVTDFDREFETGDAVSDNHIAVYSRIADGTEASTTNVVVGTAEYAYGWYIRISGAHATLFWDFVTTGQTQSSAPINVTGDTTGFDDCLAFVFAGLDGADGGAGTVSGTGWSRWRGLQSSGGASGASGVVGTKDMATTGATGTATCDWTVSDGTTGVQFAIRAGVSGPNIASVTPDEFDDDETGIVLAGTGFEASQGTGKVELSDNAVYATGTKVAQTVTSWADTSITITCDLSTLGPGTRWLWVTNDSDELTAGFSVAVHRAQAFVMSASSNITASGENTTYQLDPPATKGTGDFGGGRIMDDENPGDAVDIALDEYREDEWCLKAVTAAEDAAQYEFRVTLAGTAIDTYTFYPKWTISSFTVHDLVVQDAAHGHSADNLTMISVKTLAINDCAHFHTGDQCNFSILYDLVIQDSAHLHAADSLVLGYVNQLSIQECLHAHAAEEPVITAIYDLVVAECLHGHTADNLTIALTHTLVISECLHDHASDNIVLGYIGNLTIADCLHSHAAEEPDVTADFYLVIADCLHLHTAESPVPWINTDLTVEDSHHTHAADPCDVAVSYLLDIADCLHAHAVDNIVLTYISIIPSIDDCLHSHTADEPVLTAIANLDINEATHQHFADPCNVVISYLLDIDECLHDLTSDNLTLTTNLALEIQSCLHGHQADEPDISVDFYLVIADCLHGHTADPCNPQLLTSLEIDDCLHDHSVENLDLVNLYILSVDECLHGHQADNLDLVNVYQLAIAESLHDHLADNIVLQSLVTLDPADCWHSHTADQCDVELVSGVIDLEIQSCRHLHYADEPTPIVGYFLTINDALHDHFADEPLVEHNELTGVYPTIQNAGDTNIVREMALLDLSRLIGADLATDRLLNPSVSETANHLVDFFCRLTGVYLPSAGAITIDIRKSGANEITWEIDSTGRNRFLENGTPIETGGAGEIPDGGDATFQAYTNQAAYYNGVQMKGFILSLVAGTVAEITSLGTGGSIGKLEFMPIEYPEIPLEL